MIRQKNLNRRRVKIESSWINRGMHTASECFSCDNKLDHVLKGSRIAILCKDYCNYSRTSSAIVQNEKIVKTIDQ